MQSILKSCPVYPFLTSFDPEKFVLFALFIVLMAQSFLQEILLVHILSPNTIPYGPIIPF